MTTLVIDTSVLIDHLRGFEPATRFLETAVRSGAQSMVSVITEMELFAGQSMAEEAKERAVRELLGLFLVVPVTSPVARRAGQLLRLHRPQGLTPADALIAATALEEKAILVSRNTRHFKMIDGLLSMDLPEAAAQG